jgi:3-hydroxybutyryl-CoA dehydratase
MKIFYIKQKFTLIRTFSKNDILAFSSLSGDRNPIHLCEDYAKKTIFKAPICHGMISVSLFSNLMGNEITGSIYLSQNVEFLKPIYINETIEAIVQIKEYNQEKNNIILLTNVRKVESNQLAIEGEAVIKIPKSYKVFPDFEAYIKNQNNNDKYLNV